MKAVICSVGDDYESLLNLIKDVAELNAQSLSTKSARIVKSNGYAISDMYDEVTEILHDNAWFSQHHDVDDFAGTMLSADGEPQVVLHGDVTVTLHR